MVLHRELVYVEGGLSGDLPQTARFLFFFVVVEIGVVLVALVSVALTVTTKGALVNTFRLSHIRQQSIDLDPIAPYMT